MVNLAAGRCVACRSGEPTLTESEIAELLPHIPDWNIKEVDGMKRLEKIFKFKNFAQALEFTNKIGAIAEEENHHPLLITEWGRVTVTTFPSQRICCQRLPESMGGFVVRKPIRR